MSYTYDNLKRLTAASSTASWSQSYTYDGFGNLTAKGGSAPQTLSVNAATNRLSSAYYDNNGNMTSGFGATFTFDESNRVATAAETSGGLEYYIYSADNKRVYRMSSGGTEYWTFYGAFGEKLGVYTYSSGTGFVPHTSNIYFAGKMIVESGNPAYLDRAGTNKGVPNGYGGISSYTHYYPFGEEVTATTNDHEKFATYTRDSYTGIDYADQRYYTSTFGRFNSPDPYQASGGPASPASWNRYSYVLGDPVNHFDPRGTDCSLVDGQSPCDPCASLLTSGNCWAGFGIAEACSGGLTVLIDSFGNLQELPCEAPGDGDDTDAGDDTPPTCTLQLFRRPAKFKGDPGQHTYLDLCDGTDCEIVEGGRDNSKSDATYGDLIGFINPVGGTGVLGYNTFHGSNPGHDSQVGTTQTIACGEIATINSDVGTYNTQTPAKYAFLPNGSSTVNSNSFTYTLLYDLGIPNAFGSMRTSLWGWGRIGPFYPGWGFLVPILDQF